MICASYDRFPRRDAGMGLRCEPDPQDSQISCGDAQQTALFSIKIAAGGRKVTLTLCGGGRLVARAWAQTNWRFQG